MKDIQIEKEKMKLPFFTNDITVHVENHKKIKKKTLWNKQSCKIQVNIQKPIIFLCMCNEQAECKIKNTRLFILAPPKMKYLHINPTKCI